jgi:general secretion pathway protein G
MMFIPRATRRPWTAPSTETGESGRAPRVRSARGFTLIEMIIVITLIGILVGLALPQYKYSLKKARETVLKTDLFEFRKLINQYYNDKGKYPPSLRTLVDDGYLRQIPIDPVTRSAETWVEIREQPNYEELLPGVELGIVDAQSGSEEKGLDGTPYNTW